MYDTDREVTKVTVLKKPHDVICIMNQAETSVFTLSCTRWTSTCLLMLSCPTECVSCVTRSLVALSHFSISGRWRTTFQSAPVWSGGGFFDLKQ